MHVQVSIERPPPPRSAIIEGTTRTGQPVYSASPVELDIELTGVYAVVGK